MYLLAIHILVCIVLIVSFVMRYHCVDKVLDKYHLLFSRKTHVSRHIFIVCIIVFLHEYFKNVCLYENSKIGVSTCYKFQIFVEESMIFGVVDWPPCRPNINPTKHAWRDFKSMGFISTILIPMIWKMMRLIWRLFKCQIKETWKRIDQAHIRKLVASISARLDAGREDREWCTKHWAL